MSLDLAAFREAWEAQMQAQISAPLNVYGYTPSDPPTNCLYLRRGEITYHGTYGPPGQTTGDWQIVLRVSAGTEVDAHTVTDRFCSTGTDESVVDAVNADNTIDGTVGSMVVQAATTPTWGGADDGRMWLETIFRCQVQQRG